MKMYCDCTNVCLSPLKALILWIAAHGHVNITSSFETVLDDTQIGEELCAAFGLGFMSLDDPLLKNQPNKVRTDIKFLVI